MIIRPRRLAVWAIPAAAGIILMFSACGSGKTGAPASVRPVIGVKIYEAAGPFDELKDAHGMEFRIQTVDVRRPAGRSKRVRVSLALPAFCGACGGKWETDLRTEKGLKCEKLEASIRCGACGDKRTISFCLPEMG